MGIKREPGRNYTDAVSVIASARLLSCFKADFSSYRSELRNPWAAPSRYLASACFTPVSGIYSVDIPSGQRSYWTGRIWFFSASLVFQGGFFFPEGDAVVILAAGASQLQIRVGCGGVVSQQRAAE